jgi:hypothetical protein
MPNCRELLWFLTLYNTSKATFTAIPDIRTANRLFIYMAFNWYKLSIAFENTVFSLFPKENATVSQGSVLKWRARSHYVTINRAQLTAWTCALFLKREPTDIVAFSFGICENTVFSNDIDSVSFGRWTGYKSSQLTHHGAFSGIPKQNATVSLSSVLKWRARSLRPRCLYNNVRYFRGFCGSGPGVQWAELLFLRYKWSILFQQ